MQLRQLDKKNVFVITHIPFTKITKTPKVVSVYNSAQTFTSIISPLKTSTDPQSHVKAHAVSGPV